jgi:diaminohydroxyphosphoribosylaminopyrimidine deaminase / 5-amino-6-(5-phosphoribosylamino)uracil reductase
MNALYQLQLQSVLVEGGASLLQSFIAENCWDEARVIINNDLFIKKGLPAPAIAGVANESAQLKNDTLLLYNRQ